MKGTYDKKVISNSAFQFITKSSFLKNKNEKNIIEKINHFKINSNQVIIYLG